MVRGTMRKRLARREVDYADIYKVSNKYVHYQSFIKLNAYRSYCSVFKLTKVVLNRPTLNDSFHLFLTS